MVARARARQAIDLTGTPAARLSFEHVQAGSLELWHAACPAIEVDDVYDAVRSAVRGRGLGVVILSDGRVPTAEDLELFSDADTAPSPSEAEAALLIERWREMLEAWAARCHSTLLAAGQDQDALARALRLAPSVLERELAGAAPDLDAIEPTMDRARALAMLAAERAAIGVDPALDPVLVIFTQETAEALLYFMLGDGWDMQPSAADFRTVLASWERRYGAELRQWNGSALTLFVPRPPQDLAEARVVALEYYLVAPGNQMGDTLSAEPAGARLAMVMSKAWECRWFMG